MGRCRTDDHRVREEGRDDPESGGEPVICGRDEGAAEHPDQLVVAGHPLQGRAQVRMFAGKHKTRSLGQEGEDVHTSRPQARTLEILGYTWRPGPRPVDIGWAAMHPYAVDRCRHARTVVNGASMLEVRGAG